MAWRQKGHARVDPNAPRAWAYSDRSDFASNMNRLVQQFDFRGPRLLPLGIYVRPEELDKPCPWFLPVILPPDPEPVLPARPGETYAEMNSTQTSFPAPTNTTSEDGNPL